MRFLPKAKLIKFSPLVFSKLPVYVVWWMTLIWGHSQSLLFSFFLVSFFFLFLIFPLQACYIFCRCLAVLGYSALFSFFSLFFSFCFHIFLAVLAACRISVPWPGIEPGPQQWKPGILTTRLPGNSLFSSFWCFCWFIFKYRELFFHRVQSTKKSLEDVLHFCYGVFDL